MTLWNGIGEYRFRNFRGNEEMLRLSTLKAHNLPSLFATS